MQDRERVRGRGVVLAVRAACVVVALLALPGVARAQDPAAAPAPASLPDAPLEKPVFLVTQIDVGPGAPIDADAARDVLARRFGRLQGKVDVRSLADVKSTLDQAALAQMLGGEDAGQMEKLQEYVAVDRIVFGAIKVVGGVVDVSVKVFNADEATTEIALSRRVKADAPPSLVLAVLEQLADSLLAWTLQTYGTDTPSAAATAAAAKKLPQRAATVAAAPAPASSSFGVLTPIGAGLLGAGVGAMGVAGAHLAIEGTEPQSVDLALLGVGALLAVGGGGLVAYDLLVE
jgi:hypothetical protein